MQKNSKIVSSDNRDDRYIDLGSGDSGSAWIVTLADLLALVITFFVLLYSMSTVVKSDWEEVSKSFSQTLNSEVDTGLTSTTVDLSIERVEVKDGSSLQYLRAILEEKTNSITNLRDFLDIKLENERIIISIRGEGFFEEASSTLNSNAAALIRVMGQSLSTVKNSVEIVSYVSDIAKLSDDYPSGWELSLGRAISVLNDLRNGGYPYRISAFGQSAQDEDDILDDRQGNSQRIDIVVREEKATL